MARKKILCIDDSADFIEALKEMLEFELEDGVDILTAQSGAEGIELTKKERPDLILLDISMPGMNGSEVLHQLKHPRGLTEGEVSTATIPVIILTASGPELREQYLNMRAYDYITSPFDNKILAEKIQKLFRLRSEEN